MPEENHNSPHIDHDMLGGSFKAETLIVADSTIRSVTLSDLRKNVSRDEGNILVRRHPGATADEMSFFMQDSLRQFKPNKLIIFGGCNDIGFAQKNNESAWDIAEGICKMAEEEKKSGCSVVFVSSVLPRWGKKYEKMINRVNSMLEVMCQDHGFIS